MTTSNKYPHLTAVGSERDEELAKEAQENTQNTMLSIVVWARNRGGYVFGGYIRDRILGECPEDVDLCFPDEASAFRFVAYLAEAYTHVVVNNPLGTAYTFRGTKLRVVITESDHLPIQVDIMVGSGWQDNPDFDVNGFVYENTLHLGESWTGENELNILGNIAQKRARMMFGCKPHRVAKMLRKGWTILDNMGRELSEEEKDQLLAQF